MQHFSAETFRFLGDLTVHRDKAWFEANRDRYEGNLLGPLRSAVDDIGPALREHIPDCETRPNVNKTIDRRSTIDLPTKESHTIGGLVMTRLRRIPARGESIVESGYRFTVEEASDRTVLKLRVEPVGAGAGAGTGATTSAGEGGQGV